MGQQFLWNCSTGKHLQRTGGTPVKIYDHERVVDVGLHLLKMSLLVGKHRVDKCCDEAGVSVVAPVAEAEEGGEEAGDDEDGEQDDQGRGEGRC